MGGENYALALSIKEGLDFILSHFETPIFPRTVATRATKGGQRLAGRLSRL
ncbi:MAG: hypothetical protein WBX01_08985 [Nitrososphaeraceae archaeon]